MQPYGSLLARAGLWLAMAVALGACSKTVVVQASFPRPLVEPLPLRVGLRYPQEFTDYRYTEQVPDDADWTFELGKANTELFDKVFGAMFSQAVKLDDQDATRAGVDLVIEPRVEALEFSLPRNSRSDQYAVWIRYNIKVTRPNGTLIVNWPVSAYGQTDSRRFHGARSMEHAARLAMRDAAATIAAGLADKAKIDRLLAGESEDIDPDEPGVVNAGAAPAADGTDQVMEAEEESDAG